MSSIRSAALLMSHTLLYFSRLCQHAVESFAVGGHDVDDREATESVLLGLLGVGYGFVTDEILGDLAPVGRVCHESNGSVVQDSILRADGWDYFDGCSADYSRNDICPYFE